MVWLLAFRLLALWAGVAHADALQKGAKSVIALRSLKPSQMEIGSAEVNESFNEWVHAARKEGVSLAHYARITLIPKFAKMDLDAVVDPSGAVRATDGHHRICALLRLARETGVEVAVRVKIDEDYRGVSKLEFARDFFVRRGDGYFTRAVQKMSLLRRLAMLPDRFEDLHDSTMRSAMGELFRHLGIDDLDFVDYTEFKVGDWLVEHHLFAQLQRDALIARGATRLPQALIHDERTLQIMSQLLSTPDGRFFMRRLAEGRRTRKALEKHLVLSSQ